ncbi:MAG: citramalate synthase [Dehalococcoidia bacterium]|nr:citramalate synthase [Dehalococcoidia bacterium]
MSVIQIYDTTLRDGAQREGISFTAADKLVIAHKLDELGVMYIEGGWPGANPKDSEFFAMAREAKFQNATMVAFGSTRKHGVKCEDDTGLGALIKSGVKIVTLVGKCSARQVTQVLGVSLEDNLDMVASSVTFLCENGIGVFLDAEHFFDGWKDNRDYAMKVLKTATNAGCGCLVLCDTNGGTLPEEITAAVRDVKQSIGGVCIGIHAHNDAELAVANTLAAVREGATQVQGTINGFGERCGNANLCSVIPALKLKMDINCVSDEQLSKLTEVSRFVSETANLSPESFMPYVGLSAFSHKAGLHVSGMARWKGAYQHIDPDLVGNNQRVLVSEQSGRTNIIQRAKEIGVELTTKGPEVTALLEQVKELENRGFQYENAEASFDLLVYRMAPDYKKPFELVDYMVVVEKYRRIGAEQQRDGMLSEAMVKVKVGDKLLHTAAEGDGPVNALDNALRNGLLEFYSGLADVKLMDYKVRILEESTGTESQVRVLIESTDGVRQWRTVGSSANIIEASWLALADSLEYWLVTHINN